jgi:hypothetical protein
MLAHLTLERSNFVSSVQRSQSVAYYLDNRPLAGRIGGEIDGVQLASDLPEATIATIEAAPAKYKSSARPVNKL